MNNLLISKKRNGFEIFPQISLNVNTGICSISGESYMQNSRTFFKPVLEWLDEYISSKKNNLELICKLGSFNTGTSRVLFEILEKLKRYKEKGANVNIKWYFEDTKDTLNDDIVDLISEFGINLQVEAY